MAAVLLPFVPVGTVDENSATGMVLLGFALGWALLAGFSARSTEPQRWAVAMSVFMGAGGVIVLVAPDGLDALGWIWPPALLALVVWSYRRARQDLHSRTRRLLINPVLAVLVVVALAGGLETVNRSLADEPAMSGQLVDVGPYRLHLQCTGTGLLRRARAGRWRVSGDARVDRACGRPQHSGVCLQRPGPGGGAARDHPGGTQIVKDLHTLCSVRTSRGPMCSPATPSEVST